MDFYLSKMEWDNVTSMEKAHKVYIFTPSWKIERSTYFTDNDITKLGFKDGVSESDCWRSFFQVLREKTVIP